jgi:hypothetical protein
VEHLRPNGQRAKHAIILIWIVMAMEIVSLISGYMQYVLLTTAANGGEITRQAAADNDTRQRIIAITYLIAYIVSSVVFIRWFRRAYYNLHLRVNFLAHSEGWAAGGWFVPIVNLYRPYRIMKELYLETNELLAKDQRHSNTDITTTIVGWWWTLWIINSILGQFVFRFSRQAETINDLITSTVVGMIAKVVGIQLAFITVKLIRDYSRIEPLIAETMESEEITYNNDLANEGDVSAGIPLESA